MSEQTETVPASNAFTQMLAQIRGGAPLTDLTVAMQECVAASKDHQKPSKMVYTIKFEPKGTAMIVTDAVEVKLPKEDRLGSVFFPTELNTLTRDNPEQRQLDLKTVEADKPTELVQVKAQTL